MIEDEKAIEILKANLQRELMILQDQFTGRQNAFNSNNALKQSQVSLLGSYATLGLRTLITLNAGATIGILTFLGNLWAKDSVVAHHLANKLMTSVKLFVFGMIAAMIAMLLSYVSQATFLEKGEVRTGFLIGNVLRFIAGSISVVSLITFASGSLAAARALAHASP